MTGTYDRGSLVLDEVVPVASLREGDVITYRPPAGSGPAGLVTHRIVKISRDKFGGLQVPHQGRRQRGRRPVDVLAQGPRAGARQARHPQGRLRRRRTVGPPLADADHRRPRRADRPDEPRRHVARGGRGSPPPERAHRSRGVKRLLAALALPLLAALVLSNGARPSGANFVAASAHGATTFATATAFNSVAVTVTNPGSPLRGTATHRGRRHLRGADGEREDPALPRRRRHLDRHLHRHDRRLHAATGRRRAWPTASTTCARSPPTRPATRRPAPPSRAAASTTPRRPPRSPTPARRSPAPRR